ncbi:equilibrative nucleoside transporter family protein [Cavenderia fasciculata]|uniref:Equilibrative nucleoside transporter family protein n=1 Tax=Cavenderia fasciculata TaxID=261658 RepID=F4PG43_CACFS|nr:equilibrative nucleoside transporter family protein [Cavenderia fasciculata]EGG24677.1 equilibrative nucleoside transporter family protein [Cavenderia fasciculata]|eukprot:XP_004362528.1 equilibrative nucleoside transporter family protein [Cavenderia fasciculata]
MATNAINSILFGHTIMNDTNSNNSTQQEDDLKKPTQHANFSVAKIELEDDREDEGSQDEYLPMMSNQKDIRVAIIMIILGTGYLFPFESFLMSLDYFTVLYPEYKIYSTFPFVYMGAIAITFLFFLKFPNFSSHTKRMVFGFGFYILIMIAVPIINLTSAGGSFTSYIITLVLMILTGVIDGFVQGTVYAIAGLMGPQYTQYTQVGVGLAGIIVSVTRIISKVSFAQTAEGMKQGSLLFFLISAFVILVALGSFLYLLKLPVGINIRNSQLKKPAVSSPSTKQEKSKRESGALRFIFRKNLQLAMMNFYIFVISMFLFPGIVLEIQSYTIRPDWFVIILLTVHNVFDFIGKTVPGFVHRDGKIPSYPVLWAITLGRSIFVALFFICVYTKTFTSDAWPIVFLIIFGFSNGYVCSIVMSEGPRLVKRDLKELSGIFMTTSLIIGLTIGSTLNFMVIQLTH